MLDGAGPPLIVAVATVLVVLWRQWYSRGHRASGQMDVAMVCVIVAVAAFLEVRMGRPLKYRSGPVRLWSGNVQSDQNSQQVADPYTFTHFIHGAAFYGVTRIALPSASVGLRAIAAIALESAWEAYENTDTVINRYRESTISLGHYGDSVINSIADLTACAIGFFLAWRLPKAATLGWVPFDVIRRWQMAV